MDLTPIPENIVSRARELHDGGTSWRRCADAIFAETGERYSCDGLRRRVVGRSASARRAEHATGAGLHGILGISDLHPPDLDTEWIDRACEIGRDCSTVVLAGDVFDHYSTANFLKRKHISLEAEYEALVPVVRRLAERFEHVHLIEGNHDARWRTAILKGGSVSEIYRWLAEHSDPLAALANDCGANVHAPTGPDQQRWWLRIGDAVWHHLDRYSSAYPGASHWQAYRRGGLPGQYDGVRAWVMGHTHSIAQCVTRAGHLLIEQGCCCHDADYVGTARGVYSPGVRGCSMIWQRDGVTEIERCSVHWAIG